jgi:hypothetical protein
MNTIFSKLLKIFNGRSKAILYRKFCLRSLLIFQMYSILATVIKKKHWWALIDFVGCFYVTPTQYRSYGDVPALLVEEDLSRLSVHFSGTNGYPSRTADVRVLKTIKYSFKRKLDYFKAFKFTYL